MDLGIENRLTEVDRLIDRNNILINIYKENKFKQINNCFTYKFYINVSTYILFKRGYLSFVCFYVSIYIYYAGREGTLDCLLHWYPKFYNNVSYSLV